MAVMISREPTIERLATAHSALRKLPPPPAGTAPEKHLFVVHQDDAHVSPKTFGVDEVAHMKLTVCHKRRGETRRCRIPSWRDGVFQQIP